MDHMRLPDDHQNGHPMAQLRPVSTKVPLPIVDTYRRLLKFNHFNGIGTALALSIGKEPPERAKGNDERIQSHDGEGIGGQHTGTTLAGGGR